MAEGRRWTIYKDRVKGTYVRGVDTEGDEVEVMPVSEHEAALAKAQEERDRAVETRENANQASVREQHRAERLERTLAKARTEVTEKLEAEIAFMRQKGDRNKPLIHFEYAERLQSILDSLTKEES